MFATDQQATAGSHHATEDPDEADDFLLTDSGIAQRILTNPGVLLFIGLVVVTVAAERSLLSAGTLGGGALLPAGGAASVWHQYLLGFHPTGVGSPSISPAYLVILAMLATVLTGKAWLAVDVILLGCVPIAGLTAYFAIRRVTASVPVRVWVAATYALIPVAAGAIAAGRVGTAAAFALIPLIGLLAGRMFSQPPRIARRAAWATGLVTAVAAAFVPLVWLIALLAGVVAAALLRAGRRHADQHRHRRGRAGGAADPVDVPARGAPVRAAAQGRRPAARPGQPAPGDQVADAAQPRRSRPAAVLGERRADHRRAGGAAGVAAAAPAGAVGLDRGRARPAGGDPGQPAVGPARRRRPGRHGLARSGPGDHRGGPAAGRRGRQRRAADRGVRRPLGRPPDGRRPRRGHRGAGRHRLLGPGRRRRVLGPPWRRRTGRGGPRPDRARAGLGRRGQQRPGPHAHPEHAWLRRLLPAPAGHRPESRRRRAGPGAGRPVRAAHRGGRAGRAGRRPGRGPGPGAGPVRHRLRADAGAG